MHGLPSMVIEQACCSPGSLGVCLPPVLDRGTDSPVPGGPDQGGSGSFRRRSYLPATDASIGKPGHLSRATSSMRLGGNDSSNPNSPSGMVRTPSSGAGAAFMILNRQDSGSLGDVLGGMSGSGSPYGSGGGGSSAAGAAAMMGGAFSSSSGGGQVGLTALGQQRASHTGYVMSASPLGNSSSMGLSQQRGLASDPGNAGLFTCGSSGGLQTASSAGSGPSSSSSRAGGGGSCFSRPSSGSRASSSVCELVDAVRSKSGAQLQKALSNCNVDRAALNALHPVYDKTALHEAVSLGLVSMVRTLLAAGSDPTIGHRKEGGPLLQVGA